MSEIFETKVSYPDLGRARRLLYWVGASHVGTDRQSDTYFHVRDGWLKVRESHKENDDTSQGSVELIGYRRTSKDTVGVCAYHVTEVADGEAVRALLCATLGRAAEVRKRREKWIYKSTIIHLDEVDKLGSFVELETTSEKIDRNSAKYQHLRLAFFLGIRQCQRLHESYANLLGYQSEGAIQ